MINKYQNIDNGIDDFIWTVGQLCRTTFKHNTDHMIVIQIHYSSDFDSILGLKREIKYINRNTVAVTTHFQSDLCLSLEDFYVQSDDLFVLMWSSEHKIPSDLTDSLVP